MQRIDYYPQGESIPRVEHAPDVFVTLDLGDLEESGLLIEHRLKADIQVTASDNLVRSNHSYIDNLTPPQITFRWNGTLQHDSTTAGLRSSGAKYKLAAEDIAKQIAGALVKQSDKWREKHGPLPVIPEDFYPAYQAAPTPPALQKRNAELLFTGHGLMNRNQTVWRFESEQKPGDLLLAVNEELTADGWTAPDFRPEEFSPHLRAKRDGVILEVFPDREAGHDVTIEGRNDGDQPAGPRTYYATYLDRMSHDEILAACKKLLESKPPVETLVIFSRHWHGDRDLQRQALEYLQAQSARSPEALIAMTELLRRDKRDEEARQTLLAADALSETLPSPDKYESRLKGLAKELKMEDFPPKSFDVELLGKYGVRELLKDTRIADMELGLDEPAVYLYQTADGSADLYSFRVVSAGNEQYEMAFVASRLGTGSREWGRGGSVRENQWSSQQRSLDERNYAVRFFVRKLPNVPRFVAAIDVIDANNPPAKPPYEK